mgnify:CR=1 FL=1
MTKIAEIHSIHTRNLTPEQAQKRKQTTENVATGVGVTGYASRYASKRGILGSMLGKTNQAAHVAAPKIKEATTLFGKFKQNTTYYTEYLMNLFKNYENSRFIGPIVKNPIVRKATGGLGAIMAFFVLVTGVRKAAENGASALNKAKHKYDYMAA